MPNKTDRDEFWESVKNTQKTLEQVLIIQKETALQMKETDKELKAFIRETTLRSKETDRKMQETDSSK